MKHYLLFILLGLSFHLSAQNTVGKVTDSINNPIWSATITMLSADSTYLAATITDEQGVFSLNMIPTPKEFLLLIEHTSFESKTLCCPQDSHEQIVLTTNLFSIDEAIVAAERPMVKAEEGLLIYDAQQISKNKVVNNAYESLLQVPAISEQSGVLALAGAGSVSVIINGKPTTMSQENLINMLKSTPASRIEDIEVAYSAPSKYRIKGAAINIVMKKGFTTDGIQGSIFGTYNQKYYANGNGGASILFSNEKITSDLQYSIYKNKNLSNMDLISNHYLSASDDITKIEQFGNGNSESVSHFIRYGFDYNITKKDALNVTYTGSFTPESKAVERSEGNIFNSLNHRNSNSAMNNIDLSYTSGFGFSAGANYTNYATKSIQDFSNTATATSQTDDMKTNSKQNIDKVQAYISQEHTLPSGWGLNYGGTFNYAWNNNSQTYITDDSGNGADSESTLLEESYGLYLGASKQFTPKLSASLSVAGDYYHIGDTERWSLLPSANLSYTISPKHIIQYSFSSDKKYPSYWELQESISYVNGYTEIHGNPYITPAVNYSTQLVYILKQKYIFVLFGRCDLDHFVQLGYQSPDRLKMIYQTLNWDYQYSAGANVIIPFKVKDVWDARFTFSGYYTRTKGEEIHDMSLDREALTGYVRMNNTFKLSNKPAIHLEVSGYYITGGIQGYMDIHPMWGMDAGIKCTFDKGRASLTLKANDMFNTFTPYVSANYQKQNYEMIIKPDNRYIDITFTYRFGGYKEKKRKSVDTSRYGI